jgi:hypothetical protein
MNGQGFGWAQRILADTRFLQSMGLANGEEAQCLRITDEGTTSGDSSAV